MHHPRFTGQKNAHMDPLLIYPTAEPTALIVGSSARQPVVSALRRALPGVSPGFPICSAGMPSPVFWLRLQAGECLNSANSASDLCLGKAIRGPTPDART